MTISREQCIEFCNYLEKFQMKTLQVLRIKKMFDDKRARYFITIKKILKQKSDEDLITVLLNLKQLYVRIFGVMKKIDKGVDGLVKNFDMLKKILKGLNVLKSTWGVIRSLFSGSHEERWASRLRKEAKNFKLTIAQKTLLKVVYSSLNSCLHKTVNDYIKIKSMIENQYEALDLMKLDGTQPKLDQELIRYLINFYRYEQKRVHNSEKRHITKWLIKLFKKVSPTDFASLILVRASVSTNVVGGITVFIFGWQYFAIASLLTWFTKNIVTVVYGVYLAKRTSMAV